MTSSKTLEYYNKYEKPNELNDDQLEVVSGGDGETSEYDWKWYMVCDMCGEQRPYKDRQSLFNRIRVHRDANPSHQVMYAIK